MTSLALLKISAGLYIASFKMPAFLSAPKKFLLFFIIPFIKGTFRLWSKVSPYLVCGYLSLPCLMAVSSAAAYALSLSFFGLSSVMPAGSMTSSSFKGVAPIVTPTTSYSFGSKFVINSS